MQLIRYWNIRDEQKINREIIGAGRTNIPAQITIDISGVNAVEPEQHVL